MAAHPPPRRARWGDTIVRLTKPLTNHPENRRNGNCSDSRRRPTDSGSSRSHLAFRGVRHAAQQRRCGGPRGDHRTRSRCRGSRRDDAVCRWAVGRSEAARAGEPHTDSHAHGSSGDLRSCCRARCRGRRLPLQAVRTGRTAGAYQGALTAF